MHRSPGSIYWMKTYRDQDVPMKTLFMLDVPIPAKKAMEMLSTFNIELRKKWDQAFLDHEILESYSDGQCVFYRLPVSWPLSDRSYVLFGPPAKQVDWYGQDAFLLIQKNAWHPSKPADADKSVRATNGGNFTILIPDEKDPTGGACKMFGLRNNNYNGVLPKSGHIISFVISRKFPASFNHFRECMIEGYSKYFKVDN